MTASRNKPAIGHVCLSRGWGGLELYSLRLHRAFLAAGHRCVSFVIDGSRYHETLVREGLEYRCIKPDRYFSPVSSMQIRRGMRETNIEIAFVHILRNIWITVPALIGMDNVRLFGFNHNFVRDVNKKDFLHRWLYSRLEKYILLTELQKTEILKCLPLPGEKYAIVPNGVDCEEFHPGKRSDSLREELGARDGECLIGLVGRMHPAKGHLELVDAARILKERRVRFRVAIVGGPSAGNEGFREELEKRILELKLHRTVRIFPFQEDISPWMASFDLFVMPSHEESFGIVLLEAMASGVPAIGTDAGGVPEILGDNEYGLLVAPESAPSLADGILECINHPQAAASRAARARKKTEEVYDSRVVFRKILGMVGQTNEQSP